MFQYSVPKQPVWQILGLVDRYRLSQPKISYEKTKQFFLLLFSFDFDLELKSINAKFLDPVERDTVQSGGSS